MRKAIAVGRKELKQIARDRRTLLILLFIPAFFLLLYGYALNFDIRHIALAVEDRDGSRESRALVSAFVNSRYFDYREAVFSPDDINRVMDRDIARAILVIPEDTGRRIREGENAPVQLLLNGDNANTAATVMGYASTIVQSVSITLQLEEGGEEMTPPVVLEPRVWYNPELRSALFLVPGLIAYISMLTAVVSTALSVVKEKEWGTLEQVRMAPIGSAEYLVGKSLPYFAIALLSAVLVVLASMVLFDLPMRGSWLSLLSVTSLFLIGALGTGLLISSLAESQQVAFQMGLLIAFLPTLMLSGFIFPIASMPAPVRTMTYVVPARYYLVALKGILLKGAALRTFPIELMALAIYAAVMLGLASVRLAREH